MASETITRNDLLEILTEVVPTGGGSAVVDATSVPTADTVSKFDATAHMNSTDMTATEVNTFVDNLQPNGMYKEWTLLHSGDGNSTVVLPDNVTELYCEARYSIETIVCYIPKIEIQRNYYAGGGYGSSGGVAAKFNLSSSRVLQMVELYFNGLKDKSTVTYYVYVRY